MMSIHLGLFSDGQGQLHRRKACHVNEDGPVDYDNACWKVAAQYCAKVPAVAYA